MERILAEPGIEPATSCFQFFNATDWAMGLRSKLDSLKNKKKKIFITVQMVILHDSIGQNKWASLKKKLGEVSITIFKKFIGFKF